jgi:hypothetical protein
MHSLALQNLTDWSNRLQEINDTVCTDAISVDQPAISAIKVKCLFWEKGTKNGALTGVAFKTF